MNLKIDIHVVLDIAMEQLNDQGENIAAVVRTQAVVSTDEIQNQRGNAH